MGKLKVGDEIFVNKNRERGIIKNFIYYDSNDLLIVKNKDGDVIPSGLAYAGVNLENRESIKYFDKNEITKIEIEKPKETIPFKIVGAEKEGCKIFWNDIDDFNLEFSVEGRANIVTVLKVLIKHLDLKEFKYERICPYKVRHEYPCDNKEKNHIFSIKYVDFNGKIKTQEIIRTDKSLAIENCKFNVFIPDLLEIAKDRNIVVLEDDYYRVKENKLNGVCNDYQPICEVDRKAFEEHGWKVPNSFENKFMKYKKF